MNAPRTAILAALLMLFSSIAGCLDNDEETDVTADDDTVVDDTTATDDTTVVNDTTVVVDDTPEILGKAMVSTYHVEQLVSAIGGSHLDVEMMSTTNVPVHDYEPSGDDVVRLQESDIFFYHGLNLEPWVETTLSTLGANAPTAVQTHAMPSGETALDFESLLVDNLCDLLVNGPFENTTLAHDDHDEGHDDESDMDDGHEDHGHEEHGHAEAEETIVNPAGCPSDTNISIFHMEAGEHVLEFEEASNAAFNMAVLQMPGGHAHHHHAHGDGAFEWAGIFELSDNSHTWSMQKVGGDYADPSMRIVLIPTSTPTEEVMHTLEGGVEALIEGDSCTVVEDGGAMASIATNGSCFELHVGTGDDSTYTIDTTGLTGLAVFAQHVPTEFERDQHYLKDSAGEDIEPMAQERAGGHHHDHGHGSETEGEIEAEEGEEEFNYDPHSWLDPLAFKAQAQVVLDALKVAFPSGAANFTANAEAYMAQLDSLHSDFQSTFPSDAACTSTKVIANHNAYSYLAKRYDLKFISIHGLDPEGEPSAADIAEAVEEINEDGITVLFIEEYTSTSAVDRIVELTVSDTMPNGIGVEYLYTMEMKPKDSSDDYISLMKKSMESLKDGLGC